MQCNALNIKTASKQVWLYFIRRTTPPEYAGTTTNLQIVLNTQKKLYLNQATPKKILANFSYPKKIPESKISNPKKSFAHLRHLKSGVPPPGHQIVKIVTWELLYDVVEGYARLWDYLKVLCLMQDYTACFKHKLVVKKNPQPNRQLHARNLINFHF